MKEVYKLLSYMWDHGSTLSLGHAVVAVSVDLSLTMMMSVPL